MSQKGMLPLPLAFEIKREIYDFLNVSFEIKATKSGDALKRYYIETSPLVKGPFIKMSLPYEATESVEDSPLSLKMEFPPYKHQLNAFNRLIHTNAKNTIVTTGTGSGKTECFLFPILDYVSHLKRKGQGEGGIKAIILYPMNALLDDQAMRFVKTIKEEGSLKDLDIRVGKYTGDGGKVRAMDFNSNKVIDHRNEIATNPPDILLTNYKMLDYMLFREKEKNLWNENTKEVLKYLVLDEMHTFDGAQGSDVACLIRRLKSVSQAKDNLTFVGTSATLSSSPDARKDLCQFASTLFGSLFNEDSIVEETKHTVATYLTKPSKKLEDIPKVFETDLETLHYQYGQTLEEYTKVLLKAFNKEELLSRPSAIGAFLSEYELFHKLLELTSKQTLSFEEICSFIAENNEDYVESLGENGFSTLIRSFITLAGFARHHKIGGQPFLNIKTSLWASELRHTLSKVVPNEEEWEFVDEVDGVDPTQLFLPSVYCASCGETGWASYYTENEDTSIKNLTTKPHKIRSNYAKGRGCILFPVSDRVDSEELNYLSRKERRLYSEPPDTDEFDEKPIPLIKVLVKEGRCPACDTKMQTRFFSLGSSSLTSVIATTIFTHPLNKDRKLISFSDSVQDASHQASFLNNRSFSFSFKKFLSNCLSPGMNLADTENAILINEDFQKLDNLAKLDFLGKYAPDKLRKKWKLLGLSEDRKPSENMMRSLKEIIRYNSFGEFTFNSRFGWSFEKIGHSGVFPTDDLIDKLLSKPKTFLELDSKYSVFEDKRTFKVFLIGFIQRLKATGSVYLSFLGPYYRNPEASYYVANKYYPDLPFWDHKISRPKYFCALVDKDKLRRKNFETLGAKTSWYVKWFSKFSESERVTQFYEELCEWLHENDILKRVGFDKEKNDFVGGRPRYVLKPEQLVYVKDLEHFRCEKCKTRYTYPIELSEYINGSPCNQRFCKGNIEKRETLYSGSYFKQYFSQTPTRINASEHTGSFDKKLKSTVEKEFKRKSTFTPNYDTNYLSCTPTMEMGIDIGDLSSVLLKSVPRNAASYLQRIGRSGRTSGNSLDFLVIDKKPHNLYFWMSPKELLNWEVVTPACRYQTSHILKRQLNAFCLDSYLHNSVSEFKILPNSFQWLEDPKIDDNKYWEGFFKYISDHKDIIQKAFFQSFEIDDPIAKEEITKYISSNGIKDSFEKVFDNIKSELTILDQNIHSYRTEISSLKISDENFFQKVEKGFDKTDELDLIDLLSEFDEVTQKSIYDIYGDLKAARKKRKGLLSPNSNGLLGKLANLGVLPGYAFPEEGCELDFNVKRPVLKADVKDPFYNISISRPPETALRELAPFNSFYTHGHKAIVDRLGIYGRKDPFTKLGHCQCCGNVTNQQNCEVCGWEAELSPTFEFKNVKANTTFEKSYVSDNSETRDREKYEVKREFLFDKPISDENRKIISFFNESSQFGYEFQTNVDIYTFNLGHLSLGDDPQKFSVCKSCGAVQDPKEKKKRQDKGLPLVNHFKSCPSQKEKLVDVTLYRKIKSDAVRIPVGNTNMVPLMKAVIRRGLNIHLKGDVGHIAIADYSQSGFEGNTFLVVFDNVPGGTGHLRDLFGISLSDSIESQSPKKFLEVLADVKKHIEQCSCEDGCYHCVLSAENITHKEKVTKKGALFHLSRLIAQKSSDFEYSGNGLLEILKEHSFDGQTEAMLFHALNTIGNLVPFKEYNYTFEEEKSDPATSTWKIQFKDSFCYLKSAPNENISLEKNGATKPDFHILDQNKKPVAYIYTDGARYHLNPGQAHPTLEKDIQLRSELSKLKKCPVLTFTYREIEELGNIAARADEILNQTFFYKFDPEFFKYDNLNVKDKFLKDETRLQLNFSLLIRLFKFASGQQTELTEKEVMSTFGPYLKNMSSEHIYFSGGSLIIKTSNIDSRTDKNIINTVPDDYYQSWIGFWQAFNLVSFDPITRGKIKFEYK